MAVPNGDAALKAARELESALVGFLRELIAIPAESRRERARCERVAQEYQSLGFDEVWFDRARHRRRQDRRPVGSRS